MSADAYGRFMGRFSEPLAIEFLEQSEVRAGQTALDVGCGPGALTAQLVQRLGAGAVRGVDPSASFVEAARVRLPGVDVRLAPAEALPFPDDDVDVALAQLVVHFMADPVQGLLEMGRVTRPGGRVAACVWDNAGGTGPLSAFWAAVRDLDPHAPSEAQLAGSREGHLVELFTLAGLHDVEAMTLTVRVDFPTFADWWDPYTLGVGPAGAYVASLDDDRRAALKAHCAQVLPQPPFHLSATAWGAKAGV